MIEEFTATVSSVGDIVTNGWSDNIINVPAPAGLNGSTLPDPVTGTGIDIVITSGGVGTVNVVWFIDDSDTSIATRLYRTVDKPAGSCGPDANGFALCMDTREVGILQ